MEDREKDGKFKKGHGVSKPIGSISKKTKAWERLGEYIVNEGAERYVGYLDTIEEDKKFAEEFRAVLEYFKPRQMRTEIKGEITTGPKKIGFEK